MPYPSYTKEVLTPELEEKEPIKNGVLWFHPKQEKGENVTGNEIYQYLKDNDMLKTCVSLKTLEYYERNPNEIPPEWKGKLIYGWKSVICRDDGWLSSPYLRCSVDALCVGWCGLDDQWNDHEPGLREQVTQNSESLSSRIKRLEEDMDKIKNLFK